LGVSIELSSWEFASFLNGLSPTIQFLFTYKKNFSIAIKTHRHTQMVNFAFIIISLFALGFISNTIAAPSYRPIVIWHGMGDTCCYSFSMGMIKQELQRLLPGVYVYSIMIGSNMVEDELEGFISNANDQVDFVCKQVKSDPNLKNGFNALGFSQGSQFLRAYVERCNDPPVYNLISMGGQHQGVADLPNCLTVNETICALVEELLAFGAYTPFVQDNVIQAQYFKDPMDLQSYLKYNIFIADINNERPSKNPLYKKNLITLNQLALFKFDLDTVVVPRDSEWFGYFAPGNTSVIINMRDQPIYTEDWIGLKILDQSGRLKLLDIPNENHMKFTLPWFDANVISVYLNNTLTI